MSILDVEHQPRAHRIVQRALASDRMPHAYLFAGPEGVGKEQLARELAGLLTCPTPVRHAAPPDTALEGEVQDGCGTCDDCRLAAAETHPDLFLVHRQLNRQHPNPTIRRQKALFLGVEVIRHFLVDRATTRPLRGRARVFIVREAERLNASAQNALLKTLEEPPPATFIILLTAALDRMLPTTRSRCQQVVFQTLPREFVARRLAELRPGAGAPEVGYIAHHAAGSLGEAIRQLDDGLYSLKHSWGDRLAAMAAGRRGFAPHSLARPLMDDAKTLGKGVAQRDPDVSDTDATRAGLRSLLAALADFYLDALHRRTGASLPAINGDQPEVIERLTADRGDHALVGCLREIALADANLGRNANVELTCETLFIRLARNGRRRAAG